MELPEDITQCGRDSLGEEDRNTTTDSHKLDVLYTSKPGKNSLQPVIRKQQGISAREKNVSDLRCILKILKRSLQFGLEMLLTNP